MTEIFQIADRYTVLRNGKMIQTGRIADITPTEVTKLMVGESYSDADIYAARDLGEPILEMENLSGQGFENVSLSTVSYTHLSAAGERPPQIFLILCRVYLTKRQIKHIMKAEKEGNMMNDMNVSFAAGALVGILLVILFALWKKRRGTEPRYDERQVVARAKAAQLALGVLAALMLVNGFVREILQTAWAGPFLEAGTLLMAAATVYVLRCVWTDAYRCV